MSVTPNHYREEQKQVSRESLRTALFILMQQESFDAISISAICKRAGISRTGFYRNYNTKEEVLIDYFDHYISPFYDRLNQLPDKEPQGVSQAYFEFVDQHSELLEVLVRSGAESILLARFTYFVSRFYSENVRAIPFTGDYAHYWNSFLSAGLYNMTIEWIASGKQAPIATLVEISVRVGG